MNKQFLKKFLGILGILMIVSAAAPLKAFACGEGSDADANQHTAQWVDANGQPCTQGSDGCHAQGAL